ncbi:MAG: glycoside hydrolase family 10 protein [Armatimonadota bacterium]
MRQAAGIVLTGLCALMCTTACMAQDDHGVLVLKRGASASGPAYEGGTVQFLDVSLADQLVHIGDTTRLPLRLTIRYNVLETAPVLLNSRLGTEYWRLYHFGSGDMSALHTRENIDVSQPGEAETTVEQALPAARYGPLPAKGLVGIRGHYYFLIDRPDGDFVGTINPPPFFESPELARKLMFTLANLERFSLEVAECQSTWEPGAPLRIKLTVTDADGESFPVLNMPAAIEGQGWRAELTSEMDYLNRPTGWIAATLPGGAVPDQVIVKATVSAMTPDGPVTREVRGTFAKGAGKASAEDMATGRQPVALPRNKDGVVRETRAAWMWGSTLPTRETVESVVAGAKRAGLNVLIPCLTSGGRLCAKSDLWPMRGGVEEGLDALGYLIERAHAAGIEVHPWFSVTYRRQPFGDFLPSGIGIIDEKGEVRSVGADVHRPEYRDFIVNVMVGIARDYQVDGIHLDYIRAMYQCYCDKCRAEFREQFGESLTDATDEQWIRWQRGAIRDIVQRTAEGVRRVRPNAIMSAAVFANMAGGAAQGQDPADWARRGWIDVVMPMDYSMQTLAVHSHEQAFLEALDDDEQLVTGLSLYMRSGETVLPRPPELVRDQIQLVRGMGIHGYTLFRFGLLSEAQAEMLKTEVNHEPAVPYFRE